MIRCSRPMSWAVASTWPSGGRRSTQPWPAASVTAKVRFEWPPAMRSNRSGGVSRGHVLGEPRGHALGVDASGVPDSTVPLVWSWPIALVALDDRPGNGRGRGDVLARTIRVL